MNTLETLLDRAAAWNQKRYEQEYNQALALQLLMEEFTEWADADNEVEQLDGLCDIAFVAAGVVWKAGLSKETINSYMNSAIAHVELLSRFTSVPGQFILAELSDITNSSNKPLTESMTRIFMLCLTQGLAMGLTDQQFFDACAVVCDSNDSKSIKKTAAHLKANNKDKGAYFVPPEPRLAAILEARNADQ